jgi:thioredoxin
MKKAFLVLAPLLSFLTACGQNPSINQKNAVEFKKLISETTGTILDVRTLNEFKNGHIKNSGLLDFYASDFSHKLLLLPKDQPVFLYCNTGWRSEKAAEILAENGYKVVYNLEHGIMEWNLKNLPVVVEPDAKPDTENKIEPDEFAAIIGSDKLVFLDFYAPWCAPCRKMMPMIDSISREYNDKIKIVKINADASKKLVKKLSLIGVPYLVLYHQGNILFSHNGTISRYDLTKILNTNITKITK